MILRLLPGEFFLLVSQLLDLIYKAVELIVVVYVLHYFIPQFFELFFDIDKFSLVTALNSSSTFASMAVLK